MGLESQGCQIFDANVKPCNARMACDAIGMVIPINDTNLDYSATKQKWLEPLGFSSTLDLLTNLPSKIGIFSLTATCLVFVQFYLSFYNFRGS